MSRDGDRAGFDRAGFDCEGRGAGGTAEHDTDGTAERPRRRAAEIRAYPDGPFLVRGPVSIVDGDGRSISVRRAVVALCRCGRSRRQPLCDGTHTAAGFTCAGTAAAAGRTPTLGLRSEPCDGPSGRSD